MADAVRVTNITLPEINGTWEEYGTVNGETYYKHPTYNFYLSKGSTPVWYISTVPGSYSPSVAGFIGPTRLGTYVGNSYTVGDAIVYESFEIAPSGGSEAGGVGPEAIEAFSPWGGAEGGGAGPEVIEAFSPFGGAEAGGEPEGDEETGIGEVEFEVSRMFEWNVGNCTPYYYTVFGYCQELNCDDIPFDVRIYGGGEDCRRRIMVTVMGCNLKEVCLALKKYKLIFKIERIFKNHRPVLTVDQDLWTDDPPQRLGEDPCRVYEEVYPGEPSSPFELPLECAEFFLEGDISETWGMHATAGFVSEDDTEGGLEFDGSAEFTSTAMTLIGNGGIEFDGDAELTASNYLGSLLTTWGVVSNYGNLEAGLVEEEGNELTIDDSTIPNDCLCEPIPVMIRVTNNLSKTSLLTYFLDRNNFDLPTEYRLFYSRRTRGWYGNLHYEGWASSSPYGTFVPETWDILFEWTCTPEIGSVSMGNYVWKFGTYIKRTIGDEDYDTRIIVGFPTAGVCPPDVNLRFTFTLNTDTELITSTSSLYIQDVELLILFDNIGLFKSYAWKDSPDLIMNVSQHVPPAPIPTFDLGKLIPEVDLQLNAPTQTPAPIFV